MIAPHVALLAPQLALPANLPWLLMVVAGAFILFTFLVVLARRYKETTSDTVAIPGLPTATAQECDKVGPKWRLFWVGQPRPPPGPQPPSRATSPGLLATCWRSEEAARLRGVLLRLMSWPPGARRHDDDKEVL